MRMVTTVDLLDLNMSVKKFLIIYSVIILTAPTDLSLACPLHQKKALIQFKHLIEQSVSMNSSVLLGPGTWDSESDCCKWDRLSCDSGTVSRQVTRLTLGYMVDYSSDPVSYLSIPSHVLRPLFSIQSLVSLDVSYMGLNGAIPSLGFANLSKLVSLDMTGNNLVGNIPVEIGNLSRLQDLALESNSLSGSIPKWIVNLRRLQSLSMPRNSFSGEIPPELQNLKNLSYLSLSQNNLVGSFPRWLRKMRKLEFLYLEDNSLFGEIPAWIFEMKTLLGLGLGARGNELTLAKTSIAPKSNLKILSLTSCGLSGNIPPWISSFTNLRILKLTRNNLEGVIPQWLAQMNLAVLSLSYNKLSGSIPHQLFQSRRLLHVNLRGNNFSGQVPRTISEANTLVTLDLSNNSFSGKKFPVFVQDAHLMYVDLSENRFSGEVPYSFPKGMRMFNLAGNTFTGALPKPFGDLTFLSHLDLHNNNIMGKIPMFLSRMTSLKFLNLRNNSFEDTIPCYLSKLDQLQIVDLSDNKLFGQIPRCLGDLSAMIISDEDRTYNYSFPMGNTIMGNSLSSDMTLLWKSSEESIPGSSIMLYTLLDLSNNQLSGEIPATLGYLQNLKALNLSRNELSGIVPMALGDMKSLESLDLSHNQLTGQIPQSFSKLIQLSSLDLSNNNLTGRIPTGSQMDRMNDPNSYANNSDLCGPQIQVPCCDNKKGVKPTEDAKQGNTKENTGTSTEPWISREMVGIGFAVGFVSTIFVTYCFGFFNLAI